MKINKKDILIAVLIVLAVILSATIVLRWIPHREEMTQEYLEQQTDALTHDIACIEKFRNPYMGNASNTTQIFGWLPLCDVPKTFELDSDARIVFVKMKQNAQEIGIDKVRRDVVYAAVAAMASIDNLEGVTFVFPDETYTVTRTKAKEILGESLADLLTVDSWKAQVQEKLTDADFVNGFYEA